MERNSRIWPSWSAIGAYCAVMALALVQAPPARADTLLELGQIGYSTRVPSSWQAQSPSNSFRLAQFLVHGPDGDANCIFFYFGAGQGGSADANLQRWQSQFRAADGGPVQPSVEHFALGGIPVTVLELAGEYSRGVGMGPADAPNAEQIMRAAIVETPQGNLIIQLYGPRAAVSATRAGFDAMVQALHPD